MKDKLEEIIEREKTHVKWSVIILGVVTIIHILMANIITLLAAFASIILAATSFASLETAKEIKEAQQEGEAQ